MTMNDIFSQQKTPGSNVAFGEQKSHTGKWVAGVLIFIFMLIAFIAWYAMGQYNALQSSDERVDAEWSHVLNQYTRRADLVPNLLAVVKSYASHESNLFNEITTARAKVTALSASFENSKDPRVLAQFQEAQRQLSAPLSRLLMIAENYPDLKANELYRDLMVQLEGTENRISYSRQRYIEAVANYNFGIRRFPTNLIAMQADYKPRPRFKAENESVVTHPPKID